MAKSHVQDGVEPTWGNSISSWIKQLVEETPVTGDEIDQARTSTNFSDPHGGVEKLFMYS